MNAGRAEQIGTPDDVYLRPATTFVAHFIGSPPMNLFSGRLSGDDETFIVADGSTILLPQAFNVYTDRELILGIRPEDLLVTDASAALQFAVETVESLGAEALAHGRFGGQSVVVGTAGRDHPLPGTKLGVTFATDTLHWFDPQDGRRIDAQQSATDAERNRDTRKLA